ncbi:MAG: tetratricopeptide repeat protein [Candidatus Wallbacteria bacterium]|nr:tetratricopeptide repeat protein [Candidatus Wallbacteria bacterium]
MDGDADGLRGAFAEAVGCRDEAIDLARAALLIAQREYRGLDVGAYMARIDGMADAIRSRLPRGARADRITSEMNRYLFEELGLKGNAADYYDPRNSFLNDVIDRKLGIPITLCILYMEVGRRLGVRLDGISFPGHFLVKLRLPDGDLILDPYHRGMVLDEDALQRQIDEALSPLPPAEERVQKWLVSATKRDVLARMLRNLKAIYTSANDLERALGAADWILVATPDVPAEVRDRATLHDRLQHGPAALTDYVRYLKLAPDADDTDEVRARVEQLRKSFGVLN